MLRKVTLKNFKAYGPKGTTFELAPITLILGPNSIGKSTLFQALMALKQTWEPRVTGIWSLSCSGRYVDLGSYSNVLHAASAFEEDPTDRELSVSVGWAVPSVQITSDEVRNQAPERAYLPATSGADSGGDAVLEVHADDRHFGEREVALKWLSERRHEGENYSVRARENSLRAVTDGRPQRREVEMEAREVAHSSIRLCFDEQKRPASAPSTFPPETSDDPLVSEDATLDRPASTTRVAHEVTLEDDDRAHAFFDERVIYPEPDDPRSPKEDAASVQRRLDRILGLRKKLTEIVHIGPLRHAGARLYHPGVPGMSFVGYDGRDFVGVLTEDPDETPERLARLSSALQSLEIPYELELRPVVTQTRYAYELLLRSSANGSPEHFVGLPDVGFGISQVAPLLAQYVSDWMSSPTTEHGTGVPSRTILVEQPELHLHPLWQANLVRYFCRSLRASRDAGRAEVPPQVIMETHSELMVVQVMEMVKRKVINPEDVSILFIYPDEVRGPQVKRIRVGADGRELDVWPTGFFPERHRIRSREG
ncbi:AAA family ATPase [Myxococcota bacterium]|nr:AAA family ATPase [Myxococcota bacterium]